jgi:hypothetical protein
VRQPEPSHELEPVDIQLQPEVQNSGLCRIVRHNLVSLRLKLTRRCKDAWNKTSLLKPYISDMLIMIR